MKIREAIEEREVAALAPQACASRFSRGRAGDEPSCPVRTCFQVDRDRILHSKSFRRLKHKTQVFLSPEGDHYRTRLTHTLEVAQIARTVARALRLNEDLTEAIALGHDLGHTPFGHAGERVLDELLNDGFHHVRQSLRVVERLENDGLGLNLTWEVRDGILHHSKGRGALLGSGVHDLPAALEGQVVRLADVVAYVSHDLDDAIRAGLIGSDAVPSGLRQLLGSRHGERINTMVVDMIETSLATDTTAIRFSAAVSQAVTELRDWLFLHVYQAPSVAEDFYKASHVLHELFGYFVAHPAELAACGGRRAEDDTVEVAVADFLAGMTDRYAMNLYQQLFLPQPWKVL
ncbi:MAG: deoxyguanosinetriphosphate triphosphohydrolase [Desulfuromonas sp.]|nr:deoxyguanosinetriphosphate triphosphohydrolase [Desulfuromonas sp.]